jgi:hypothetical protein
MHLDAFAQAKTPELLRCWDSAWGQVEGCSSAGRPLLRQQKGHLRGLSFSSETESDGKRGSKRPRKSRKSRASGESK